MEGALGTVFGVDTQLIADGTYFVVEVPSHAGTRIVGCGGWSKRKTLFGSDRRSGREDAFGHNTPSSQDQSAPLWFRDRIAKLSRRVNPQANCILRIGEGGFLGATVRAASRELRHLCHERFVFFAPVDDDFVFDHGLEPSLAFRITIRTCLTWYGFAFAPALCKLIFSSTPLFRNR